jgi:hypothetical protein
MVLFISLKLLVLIFKQQIGKAPTRTPKNPSPGLQSTMHECITELA